MKLWKHGEYTSVENVPPGLTCYEVQVHVEHPPECMDYDDIEIDSQDESGEDQELPECLLGFTRIEVIGHEIGDSKAQAIEFAVKRAGAISKENFAKHFMQSENETAFLIAENYEDNFEMYKLIQVDI